MFQLFTHSCARHINPNAIAVNLKSVAVKLLCTSLSLVFITDIAEAREPKIEFPKSQRAQRALDLDGKFGIGFVQAPLEVRGISLNMGINSNLFIEAIFGGNLRSPEDQTTETTLATALGLHLQLFQIPTEVALTVGARFHANLSEDCIADDKLCARRQVTVAPDVHYLVDIPIRLYWFPRPYLSLHTELGMSVRWGKGGASSRGVLVDGYSVSLFDDLDRIGSIGFTIWFPNGNAPMSRAQQSRRTQP